MAPDIARLPALDFDVAVPDSCTLEETAGPPCFALGVVAGVFINQSIH